MPHRKAALPPSPQSNQQPALSSSDTKTSDDAPSDRYIGLCYGPPGVGKTVSAKHYAKWDDPVTAGVEEIAGTSTVFYTAPVVGAPSRP